MKKYILLNRNYTFLFFIIFILSSIFLDINIIAQQLNLGFSMDPLVVERDIEPGNSFSYEINLDNSNRYIPITLKVSIADITENIQGSYQLKEPGSTSYSIKDIVTFEPEELTIPPGGYKTVQVDVNIPRGTRSGKYGAIVLSTVSEEQNTSDELFGKMNFTFQAASFLELNITRTTTRKEAYITDFKVQRSGEIEELNNQIGNQGLVFGVSVLNASDIRIITRGELIIRSQEGRTLARYPLGGGRGVIIPESTVELQSIIHRKNIPEGNYLARAIINYGGHRPIVSEFDFSVEKEKIAIQDLKTDPVKLFIEPEEVELNFPPGSFKTSVLKLTNRGEETIKVNSEILPLSFDKNGNLISLSERKEHVENEYDYLSWFELNPESFELKSNQSRRVRLSVKSPKEAKGAYYADALFLATTGGTVSERGINILTYAGEEDFIKALDIYIKEIKQNVDNISIEIMSKNTGNIHINPVIELALNKVIPQTTTEDGRIIAEQKLTLGTYTVPNIENPILPGSERISQVMITSPLESGHYELFIRADFDSEEPLVINHKFKLEGGVKNEL